MNRFRQASWLGKWMIAALLGALAFPNVVLAADLKIGYIDSVRILAEYEVAEEAQQTLDKELKAWEEEAEQMHQEIMAMANELESQRLMLSEANFSRFAWLSTALFSPSGVRRVRPSSGTWS